MAIDYGPGVFGVDYGVGVALPGAVGALAVEYESMTAYKKRVDGLLAKLNESPASDKKLADGTLPTDSVGEGFAEAKRLYTAYTNTHTQLLALSKGLADQIEALGIAIRTAGKGFEHVDDDTKRRMLAISKEADAQYVPERDPSAPPAPHSSASQGGAHSGDQVEGL
ncbi:hypothetical protein SAVIM338S_02896 [Streptomyces avidinii]